MTVRKILLLSIDTPENSIAPTIHYELMTRSTQYDPTMITSQIFSIPPRTTLSFSLPSVLALA